MKNKFITLSLLSLFAFSLSGEELTKCEGEILPIYRVSPEYPSSPVSGRRDYEGSVTFEFTLDDEGVPKDIKILNSTSIAFEGPSLTALQQWKFPPQSTPCKAKTRIAFKLAE